MTSDTDIARIVRQELTAILSAGDPYTGIPLIDPESNLLAPPVLEAIRGPLESSITDIDESIAQLQPAVASLESLVDDGGRLSEPELNTTIGALRPDVYFSARGRPDGPLPTPWMTDSGHPYTLTTEQGDGSGFSILGGALQAPNGLDYFNMGPLPSDVREVSMTVRWTDEAKALSNPAVAIVADRIFHAGSNTADYADSGHALIFPDRFNFQKRPAAGGGGTTTYLQVIFPTVLAFGVDHTFGLLWDGKRGGIRIPNGQVFWGAEDATLKSYWGNFATVEVVANAADNKVGIVEFGVSTEVRPSVVQPRVGALIYHHETNGSGAGGDIVPVASNTLLLTGPATLAVPQSKKVLIRGSAWFREYVPVANVSALLILSFGVGNSTYTRKLTLRTGMTFANGTASAYWREGHMEFEGVVDLSAFTAGTLQSVVLYGSATASMFEFVNAGSGDTTALGRRSWIDVYEYA